MQLSNMFFHLADLLVGINELPNSRFNRDENDLIYIHKLPLIEALCTKPVRVETLDGRILLVSIDQIVTPQTQKIVLNEGMPIFQGENDPIPIKDKMKGNLIIQFDIEFPKFIKEEDKKILFTILN